jgi:L-lysine 2,3-aminomutase
MSDAALHLVERVFPKVPIRQWVCSLPWQLRTLLGYDRQLCSAVMGALVKELTRSYERRAMLLTKLK